MTDSLQEGDHLANLREDGFTILRGIFRRDYLEERIPLIEEIVEYWEDGLVDPFVSNDSEFLDHRTDQGALYDVVNRYPAFQGMAKEDRILDVLEELLGPNIFLYVSSIVYKPTGADNEVPLHQDFLSRPEETVRYIAWMPFSDVSRNDGCLKAIPGSHKEGYRSWHRVEGETHHDRLDADQFDESEITYLEMDAGDVLIFHNQLVHGSDRADAGKSRYALRVVYKGMTAEDMAVPRTGPVVLRGGDPERLRSAGISLRRDNLDQGSRNDKHVLRRLANRLGRWLADL